MNFCRILSTAVVVVFISSVSAFAAPDASVLSELKPSVSSVNSEAMKVDKKECSKNREEFNKDPIKALNNRKEKIQSLVKDGKMTKEKADKLNTKINTKIKEIENFNKLSVKQKKEKLISDFKLRVEKKVTDGKLDRAKADTLVKDFTEKINNWDGNGYPHFYK